MIGSGQKEYEKRLQERAWPLGFATIIWILTNSSLRAQVLIELYQAGQLSLFMKIVYTFLATVGILIVAALVALFGGAVSIAISDWVMGKDSNKAQKIFAWSVLVTVLLVAVYFFIGGTFNI